MRRGRVQGPRFAHPAVWLPSASRFAISMYISGGAIAATQPDETCQLFTQVRNQLVNHVAAAVRFQLPITKGCRILILHAYKRIKGRWPPPKSAGLKRVRDSSAQGFAFCHLFKPSSDSDSASLIGSTAKRVSPFRRCRDNITQCTFCLGVQ